MEDRNIRSRCNACTADVELPPSGISLILFDTGISSYAFRCDTCSRVQVKPADAHIQSLLKRGGVEPVAFTTPTELLEHNAGPPLNVDDVLDFILDLEAAESDGLANAG